MNPYQGNNRQMVSALYVDANKSRCVSEVWPGSPRINHLNQGNDILLTHHQEGFKMRIVTIFKLVLVPAFLIGAGSSAIAGSCGLPLPCSNTAKSSSPALTITNTGSGIAGLFDIDSNSDEQPALVGETQSDAVGAVGVFGRVNSVSAGENSTGVVGKNLGTNPDVLLMGVWGQADAGGGVGVLGQSEAGIGVSALSTTGTAVSASSTIGNGVVASSNKSIGVWGKSNTRAIVGTQGNTSCPGTYGVGGCATTGNGVVGQSPAGGIGVWGNSSARGVVGTLGVTSCPGTYGVGGCAATEIGVFGQSSAGGIGVWGSGSARGVVGTQGNTSCPGTYAVGGCAVDGNGVVGASDSGLAGFFQGNVQITGTLTKGAGAFKIDHPLDPGNKYLYHSFVESSDMLSIYTGNIVLDQQGEAIRVGLGRATADTLHPRIYMQKMAVSQA
jgi:hypothetical protein